MDLFERVCMLLTHAMAARLSPLFWATVHKTKPADGKAAASSPASLDLTLAARVSPTPRMTVPDKPIHNWWTLMYLIHHVMGQGKAGLALCCRCDLRLLLRSVRACV